MHKERGGARVQRTRKEVARVQVLSSLAKCTKTNEQKKVGFVVPREVPNTIFDEEDVDELERDEPHKALESALETQVLVCADEWLSVFTDYRSPSEITSCAFLSAAFPSVSMALSVTHNFFNVEFSLCIASPTARSHKKRVHMTNTHPESKDKLTDTYGSFYMPCSNSPSCCVVRMQNHSSQPRTCDHTGQKNRLESAVENGVDPSVRIFKCVALVRFVSPRDGEVSQCYSIASAKLKTPLATLCVSSA